MNPSNLTMSPVGLVLVILFIAVAIYDLVLVLLKGYSSTISQFMISVGFKSPIIVFTFGYLGGHLFSSMWMNNCVPMPVPHMWFEFAGGLLVGSIIGWILGRKT